jgi:methylated-DNA-[protein]-cysteine S-methyltransferase
VTLYDSPLGRLLIAGNDTHITQVAFFGGQALPESPRISPLIQQCTYELDEYFAGRLRQFNVPLQPQGTPFRLRVWQALTRIAYGETVSYKQLAAAIGQPNACRAVGGANHHNPIVILIPCHRVIGANGKLTGFGGGLEAKRFLLELERRG